MTNELVDMIVRKVLAELQTQGLGGSAPGQARTRPAATVSNPLTKPAETPKPAPRRGSGQGQANRPARKIFLTAEDLSQRLSRDGDKSRTIELAHNEFLTPAAKDLADLRHLAVRKLPKPMAQAGAPAGGNACDAAAASNAGQAACPQPSGAAGTIPASRSARGRTATLGMVIRNPNNTVQGVLDGLDRDGISAMEYAATNCWIVNTRTLCEAVAAGQIGGGVVMVPMAAEAVVLANKVEGIRAAHATAPGSLSAVMGRLSPNVIVLEHSSTTFHELRTMLRTFAAGLAARGSNDTLLNEIESLERS